MTGDRHVLEENFIAQVILILAHIRCCLFLWFTQIEIAANSSTKNSSRHGALKFIYFAWKKIGYYYCWLTKANYSIYSFILVHFIKKFLEGRINVVERKNNCGLCEGWFWNVSSHCELFLVRANQQTPRPRGGYPALTWPPPALTGPSSSPHLVALAPAKTLISVFRWGCGLWGLNLWWVLRF